MNVQSIIVMGIALILTIVVVATVQMLWRERRERVKEACCPMCKYPVRGMTVFLCPECGVDWRVSGILSNSLRLVRRPGLWHLMSVYTCLVVLIGFGTILAGSMIDATRETNVTRTTTLNSPAGLFARVTVESSGRQVRSGFKDVTMRLTLVPPAPAAARDYTLDVKHGERESWAARTPDGRQTGGSTRISRSELVEWIEGAGARVDTPAREGEVDELFATITEASGSPRAMPWAYTKLTAAGQTNALRTGPTEWFLYASIGFWGLVWVVGVLVIRRRVRRRVRRRHSVAGEYLVQPGPVG